MNMYMNKLILVSTLNKLVLAPNLTRIGVNPDFKREGLWGRRQPFALLLRSRQPEKYEKRTNGSCKPTACCIPRRMWNTKNMALNHTTFCWCSILPWGLGKLDPFTLKLKNTFSQTYQEKMYVLRDVVRIGSIIIFHLGNLWKAKFFIRCDVMFGWGRRGNLKLITLRNERVKVVKVAAERVSK